ncbi:hypothetical protein A2Y99_02480 [Candidatus Gottesmanbacteria bacterium RBG_13_37_7]|uniref:Cytidyltransferase-like domain-containing protein n=1 Tax=Candidatus Gottesmanbacteria bacterium RBG_13_37_7 TaxID=1798369 RepID=A0A1F5YJ42_9BACT|nr:MAG: hypothetical protein A2Y99_02480 [Candidatus Gottesmanbacteria bacterium RBG_13_37_7]
MNKIISLKKAETVLSSHKIKKRTIVLTGGCFDILHIGHIEFFKKARKEGDILVILLESDRKVKALKGPNRPIFSQKERALVLSSIAQINYIILLPYITSDKIYTDIVFKLKPDIIAVTENDPMFDKKKIQANKIKATIKIIPFVKTYSSSKLLNILGID